MRLLKCILLITCGVLCLLGCEKDETPNIDAITNVVIIDPYEDSYDNEGQLQLPYDTVCYYFNPDNKMKKVLFDYGISDGKAYLDRKVEVEGVYYVEANHLFMNTMNEGQLQVQFGKDTNEWEVLKFTSDTLIVNRYFNPQYALENLLHNEITSKQVT